MAAELRAARRRLAATRRALPRPKIAGDKADTAAARKAKKEPAGEMIIHPTIMSRTASPISARADAGFIGFMLFCANP